MEEAHSFGTSKMNMVKIQLYPREPTMLPMTRFEFYSLVLFPEKKWKFRTNKYVVFMVINGVALNINHRPVSKSPMF